MATFRSALTGNTPRSYGLLWRNTPKNKGIDTITGRCQEKPCVQKYKDLKHNQSTQSGHQRSAELTRSLYRHPVHLIKWSSIGNPLPFHSSLLVMLKESGICWQTKSTLVQNGPKGPSLRSMFDLSKSTWFKYLRINYAPHARPSQEIGAHLKCKNMPTPMRLGTILEQF